VIRKLGLWSAPLLAVFVWVAVYGQKPSNPQRSFSLYVWPYQKSIKSPKPKNSKIDPVRFLPEFRYKNGEEVHSMKLLPARQSKRLNYTGKSPLSLYRILPENNATEIVAVLHFDSHWRDTLFVLYPKDVAGRAYSNFPIDRTLASQTAGAGVVVNLTRKSTLVAVNGAKKNLPAGGISPFRMQQPGEDFTRFKVSLQKNDDWIVAHSSKRFLSKRSGTVFLLSSSSGSKLKVSVLSPPR
jgi:hypothetical protein